MSNFRKKINENKKKHLTDTSQLNRITCTVSKFSKHNSYEGESLIKIMQIFESFFKR